MGEVFGFTGYASADMFIVDDAEPVILEINPRPVPQLHLGASIGVDMGRAFADVLNKRWDGTPRLASKSRTVRLFPQSLILRRELEGRGPGTKSWLRTPGSLAMCRGTIRGCSCITFASSLRGRPRWCPSNDRRPGGRMGVVKPDRSPETRRRPWTS